MNNIAIKVSHLTKVYKLYDKPIDRLKESLLPLKKRYHKEFYALNNVSFEIKKGETVGIIGKNGAGKSTLLKIITGVLTPSSGHVHVNGRIASLLELGAGFNPEYTGVENIYLQGTLMGYTKEEIESKIQAILDFADIGDFVHQPVKSYSSGMFARLAFAVAINVEPDILIVDEALSVGDMRFQQKCYRKFKELQESKKTILFVTHDTSAIINYCSNSLWIDNGSKYDEGSPEIVCKRYISYMAYEQKSEPININKGKSKDNFSQWINISELESFGNRKSVIESIILLNKDGNKQYTFEGGETVTLKMKIFSYANLENIIIGFITYDYLGNEIFGVNTIMCNINNIKFQANKEYIFYFSFEMPKIRNGEFSISPAIAEGTQIDNIQHHWVHNALSFKIFSKDIASTMGFLIRDINPIIGIE